MGTQRGVFSKRRLQFPSRDAQRMLVVLCEDFQDRGLSESSGVSGDEDGGVVLNDVPGVKVFGEKRVHGYKEESL
jgi:hypothetical protein